jgi:hypothetical protein
VTAYSDIPRVHETPPAVSQKSSIFRGAFPGAASLFTSLSGAFYAPCCPHILK